MADYKFKKITEKNIGSPTKLHADLDNAFREVIYQRALAIEMQEARHFAREPNMPIYHKGKHHEERRVYLFVEEKIMVELKAIVHLENVRLAPAKNYPEHTTGRLAHLSILEAQAFNLKGWKIKSLCQTLFPITH